MIGGDLQVGFAVYDEGGAGKTLIERRRNCPYRRDRLDLPTLAVDARISIPVRARLPRAPREYLSETMKASENYTEMRKYAGKLI